MFDIGATELLVIAIVAIIVVGPRELPRMLRTFGQMMNKAKGLAREFQNQFDEAARDTGIDDLQKDFNDLGDIDVIDDFGDAFDPVKEAGAELKDTIEKPVDGAATGKKSKPKSKKTTVSKTGAKPKPKTSGKPRAKKTSAKSGAA